MLLLSYIVFLHQTTTRRLPRNDVGTLSYIVFLHQTTTLANDSSDKYYCLISSFYIKPQLCSCVGVYGYYCLISSFYIKPQLASEIRTKGNIVLYRLSTSNHNGDSVRALDSLLSYIVFLHQTTTESGVDVDTLQLSYIVFLHQTTTVITCVHYIINCLISSFYIKPQRIIKE